MIKATQMSVCFKCNKIIYVNDEIKIVKLQKYRRNKDKLVHVYCKKEGE